MGQVVRQNLFTRQKLEKQLMQKEVELGRQLQLAIADQEREFQEDLSIALASSRPLQSGEILSRGQVRSQLETSVCCC